MPILAQFLIGLVFGLGLVISGMSNPAKVLNFLDLGAIASGGWDASLAFVMAGAVGVTTIGYKLVLRRKGPLFDTGFHMPAKARIDTRVILGPALFGIGWGLAGFCPGPALTAIGIGGGDALLFILAMLAGMGAARWLAARARPALPAAPDVRAPPIAG